MFKKLLIITTISFYILPSVRPETRALQQKLDYSKKVKKLKSNNYLTGNDVSKQILNDVKALEDKLSTNATTPINLKEFKEALERVKSGCNVDNLGATPKTLKNLSARIRTMQTVIAGMEENNTCNCDCSACVLM